MSIEHDIEGNVWAAIAAKYSPLPHWVFFNSANYLERINPTTWKYTISLWKKQSIKEGCSWERMRDGSRVLVRIDPVTATRSYVLSNDLPETERNILFEAFVSVESGDICFLTETPLVNLSPDDFEILYDGVPFDVPTLGIYVNKRDEIEN